jgi:hypothetical protein
LVFATPYFSWFVITLFLFDFIHHFVNTFLILYMLSIQWILFIEIIWKTFNIHNIFG